MKIQRKHVVIGIILLCVGLFVGCGPVAVGKGGGVCEEEFRGSFHGRGFHHRSLDEDSLGHMLSFLDRRIALLDLNEVQEKKYEEIRGKIRGSLIEHIEDRKAFAEQLRGEINHENPDIHRIASLIKTRIRGISASVEEGLQYFVELYDQLDENQKRLIIERVRKRFGKKTS